MGKTVARDRWLTRLVALNIALVVGWWVRELLVRWALDPVEVRVANLTAWWRVGVWPYGFPDHLPALWNCYGPLYPLACVLWPEAPDHIYLPGRLLSLLACAGLVVVMVGHLRDRGASVAGTFLAVGLLLCSRPLLCSAARNHVDLLALLLGVAGWSLVIGARRPGAVVVGAAIMGLAMHAKLTALAPPLACFSYLWLTDRRRLALVGVVWGVVALGGVAWLQFETGGAYLHNALLSNAPRAWGKSGELLFRTLTISGGWLIALLAPAAAVQRGVRVACRAELHYVGAALTVAAVTAANPGSSWNYLLDFYVALALVSGLALSTFLRPDAATGRSVVRWLTAHVVLTLIYGVGLGVAQERQAREYRSEYLSALGDLEPLIAGGYRVASLDSVPHADALLRLGQRNKIDLPPSEMRRARELAGAALVAGELDVVYGAETIIEAPGIGPAFRSGTVGNHPRRM